MSVFGLAKSQPAEPAQKGHVLVWPPEHFTVVYTLCKCSGPYLLVYILTTRVSCATLSSFILANSPNSSISSCLSCNSLTQFVENPWLAQSFNMVTIIVLSLRKSPLSNVLLSTAWREDVNAAQRLSWKKAANNAVFITSLYCHLSPCYHKYWQETKRKWYKTLKFNHCIGTYSLLNNAHDKFHILMHLWSSSFISRGWVEG